MNGAEFFGNSYNSCNLGSINLYNAVKNPFTKDAEIDWDKLAKMVHLGIEILDEILDYGYDSQPLDENRKCIDKWRAIGLGAFGLGDALVALNIKYGSPEAVELAKKMQKFILIHSLSASSLIASEKGTFAAYDWNKVKKSPLIASLKNDKDWKNIYKMIETSGLRNGALISIAPNGTIATMVGMTGGAEPIFALSYERTTHANVGKGVFFRVLAKSAEHFMKLHNLPADTSDEELMKMNPAFICSHDVPPLDRVKMQAALQDSTDNAISSTVNLKEEATVDDIYNVYMEAWKSGCKGITTFRNNCSRTSILRTSHDEEFVQGKIQFNSISPISSDEIGDEVDGKKVTRKTACVPTMVNHIYSKEGNLVELYTDVTQGCSANINTITRLASLSLRSGVKVEEVLKQLRKETCSACIDRRKQGDKEVAKSCGNAIADAIEKVYTDLQGEKKVVDEKGLMTCPECGEKTLRVEAKCVRCTSCHYSKCD